MKRASARTRRTFLWLVSLAVVASMICSFVITLRPPRPIPRATSRPTRVIPTWTPTPEPTGKPVPAPVTLVLPTKGLDPAATAVATASPTPTTSSPTLSSDATASDVSGEREFVFSVCGDNRGGWEVYRKILDSVQRDGSAFLLSTGDLVDSGSESEFEEFAEFMSDFTLPFYPVPGNHDDSDGDLSAYLKYSGAPARHYSFDHGTVHFSLIDTSSGAASDEELAWLSEDIDGTGKPVKVVVLHHPPFDPAGTDHIMGAGNDAFMQLMTDKGVQLVFSGHIHSHDDAVRDGVRYIITGGAGARLYTAPGRPAFHHYVRVTVAGEELLPEVVRIE
jgi:Icc protein